MPVAPPVNVPLFVIPLWNVTFELVVLVKDAPLDMVRRPLNVLLLTAEVMASVPPDATVVVPVTSNGTLNALNVPLPMERLPPMVRFVTVAVFTAPTIVKLPVTLAVPACKVLLLLPDKIRFT